MRRWFVGLICASLLGLIGCSKTIEFTGKTEDWQVECSVHPSDHVKAYTIAYIGKDSQAVENVSYSFMNSKNFNQSGTSETSSKNLKMSGKSTEETPYTDEDDFKLHIKWNDKEDTITVVKKD
ncbi:hypothetical protein P5G65_11805 [Paenibacillus chondroitinus]|uniref:Lipoprotein n=1 Tax=Paenibacillus chondroitinus TaxID=59842 RepID=A0ABU6DCG8_9BACL|nr:MULTISPECIES: hypothetical protein [Paenibacillus]MCY9656936.1 hypothetical protein [Paenibacillus anseongense]MEB4794586.1 hypothetical protein [Paenibacillus chondroitinus]